MRWYSEGEIKRILERETIEREAITTFDEEQTPPAWRPFIAASFDPTQFIADLEFEMKFEILMRSITHRMPCG